MRRATAALAIAASVGVAAGQTHLTFRWPLIGKVSKSADGHGLDILVPEGDAVHAAADGAVIYAGDQLASFGDMVVIRHADNYVTTYAHLSKMAVKEGDAVKRGEVIGQSGKTGDVKRPELHFELRKGESSLDPLGYLAPR